MHAMFTFAVAILLARMYGIDWLRRMIGRVFGIQRRRRRRRQSYEMNILASGSNNAGRRREPSSSSESTEELDDTIENWPPALYLQTTDHVPAGPSLINTDDPPSDAVAHHAAAAAGRAAVGRRRNWIWRLPTRKVMLYCLCLHVVSIFLVYAVYLLLTDPSDPIQ